MPASVFGNRLKELRAAAELSQKELADLAGLSQNAISQWEKGEREPGWSAVVALAAALGVDCTAFTDKPAAAKKPRKGK